MWLLSIVVILAILGVSEEASCSPECLSDEVCSSVNGSSVCLANQTLYQTQNLSVYNVSTIVSCESSNMTVSVSKNLLEFLHYNPSASSASNCTGAIERILNGQRVYSLTVKNINGTCGNMISKTTNQVIYSNTILIPPNSTNGVVTVSRLSIAFSCSYNLTMETALLTVYKPVISTENLNVGSTGTEASTTLAAFVNPSYTNPLQQEIQQQLPIGSTLYIGMTSQFTDTAFVLRLEQCFATPFSDSQSSIKEMLIEGGCPASTTLYIKVEENGVSSEVRFSVNSFAFQGYDNVYIFCEARLCYKASGTCSQCASSRSSDGTGVFMLGPIIFQDTSVESSSSHTVLSFAVLLGSLLSLWIL